MRRAPRQSQPDDHRIVGREAGLADGIVITPSHNPPEDGGIKYDPPSGGPADTGTTRRIEELMVQLKENYTIAIVTHNMQQAARVSDFTGYMYLGELIEFGATDDIFLKPKQKATEDYITGRFG